MAVFLWYLRVEGGGEESRGGDKVSAFESLCTSYCVTHTDTHTHSFTVTHPPGNPPPHPYPISAEPPHTPNYQSVKACICCSSFFLSFFLCLSQLHSPPQPLILLQTFLILTQLFFFSPGKSHSSLLHPSPSQGSSKLPRFRQFLCNRSHGCGGNSPAMQHSYKIAADAMGAAAET